MKFGQPDIFYVWKAVDICFSGQYLYKFGLTQKVRGQERIDETSEHSGLRADLLLYVLVDCALARELEREALKIGRKAEIGSSTGNSEFRWLTDSEYDLLERLVKKHGATKRRYRPRTIFNDYQDDAARLRADAERKLEIQPGYFDGLKWYLTVFAVMGFMLTKPFGFGLLSIDRFWHVQATSVAIGAVLRLAMNRLSRRRLRSDADSFKKKADLLVQSHLERAADLCENGKSTREYSFRIRSTMYAIDRDDHTP